MAKIYDAAQLRNAHLATRFGDDYILLSYPPTRRMTDATKLILDLKENQPQAVRKVLELLLPELKKWEKQLRDVDRCRYIICIPGHERGKVNFGCEAIAAEIASKFTWLSPLPDVLQRTKTVKKAATAGSAEERPEKSDHMKSIAYSGPKLVTTDAVLLMDDVLTMSNTSSACREILLRDSKCKHVVGLFMGRTE
jgi:predicted amidophosphoribosyltransferase